jgi:hypothetical protein
MRPLADKTPLGGALLCGVVHKDRLQRDILPPGLCHGLAQRGVVVQAQIVPKPVQPAACGHCEGRAHGCGGPLRRQRSEQYLTCSQSRAHFRRQLNGRPHTRQVFWGKSDFLRIFIGSGASGGASGGHAV